MNACAKDDIDMLMRDEPVYVCVCVCSFVSEIGLNGVDSWVVGLATADCIVMAIWLTLSYLVNEQLSGYRIIKIIIIIIIINNNNNNNKNNNNNNNNNRWEPTHESTTQTHWHWQK